MGTEERTRSHAIEDYTKAIFALEARTEAPVATNALAARLGVTAGSVSAMLHKLHELELIEHAPYRGVKLTAAGRRIALEVIRHHRLLELFLSEALEMPWDRVHAEAEVLEHVISEELEQLIAAKLGHPTIDPHGDPIPDARLELAERATSRLDALDVGERGVVVRISDADPAKLRYLAQCGIVPGVAFSVVGRQPFGGPLFLRVEDREQTLGCELAQTIRVERSTARDA